MSSADSASQVTLDLITGRLLLASDTTFKSSTYSTASTYDFRMTQDFTSSVQGIIICSMASGTNIDVHNH